MVETTRPAEPALASAALRSCALFRELDDAGLAAVARSLRTVRFRRNEVIFHVDDPGESLFVIESGSVRILSPSPDGDEAVVATLGPGDFFGAISVLDGGERAVTAVTLEPTVLGSLPRTRFLGLFEKDPGLQRGLLAGLATELRRLTHRIQELYSLDLASRIAMGLVDLALRTKAPGPGAELSWHYAQSGLAALIGASRQSVNRLVDDLAERGLLRVEQDRIVIPDVDALARVARR